MTNELKCPVCGDNVIGIGKFCPSEHLHPFIQLRIDKEKAAAVQEAIEENNKSWRSLWPE